MRNRTVAALAAALVAMSGGTAYAAAPDPVPMATTTLHYTNNVGYSSGPADVGFNLWDVGPYPADVNALPAGHKALVWVGGDYSTCDSEYTDAEFAVLVDQFVGNTKVFGWYLWDEPNLTDCPNLAALISKRANYIRTRTGGAQKSFVVGGGGDGEAAPPELAPANSGLDLIGLDPYPCRIGEACEYSLIDQAVRQSVVNGTPLSAIVPVYQTFGQTCSSIPAGNRKWRMPTGAEMDQMLARWDSLVPNPVFDVAYSWGVQQEWACPALSGSTTLKDKFRQRFAAGTSAPCATVNLDFTAYPALEYGATGATVTAAQCLLDNAGFAPGEHYPNGVYDESTGAAVRAFQQTRYLPMSSDIDSHTWTALLAVGDTPTLRNGSTGTAVRRLQRALTAALSRTVAIDGRFGSTTERAVRDYQASRGLGLDGVVGIQTWGALQAGK